MIVLVSQSKLLASETQLINANLCQLANNTLDYINKSKFYQGTQLVGQNAGVEETPENIIKTLKHICQLQYSKNQIADLKRVFKLQRWQPDLTQAHKIAATTSNPNKRSMLNRIPTDKILLTKYYTKLVDARLTRQNEYQQAIYQLPYDEIALSFEQAEDISNKLTRYKYSRQAVMQGILDKHNLAKPLLWLTEKSLHDVMLQGTAVYKMDNKTLFFNVHRNNGISYDYALNKDQQARYWYFKQVPSIMGYGKDPDHKIPIYPNVTVAGNIKDLGLGRLILLTENTPAGQFQRLVILADEGGAFENNLFQLDLLVGSYKGWSDYHQANKHLPDFVKAEFLTLK
ncbi:hypothetical protein XM47_02665 [Catenovulum maritimum]|uniref:Lytic transglycosylase MltA domain-containing protein n=1 Tax=Catenovulum maritimum TaxID=1513271 RepID=A0A0J8GV60_9ALTE|nr:hypothetical protein XM47_02665 [Catenovulum maritimum]